MKPKTNNVIMRDNLIIPLGKYLSNVDRTYHLFFYLMLYTIIVLRNRSIQMRITTIYIN